MIKVSYRTNMTSKDLLFSNNDTIETVLDKFGLSDMPVNSFMLAGEWLNADKLEDEIGKYADAKGKASLTKIVKMDNAAQVSCLGAVAVLESKLTLDQLKKVIKYRPDALTVVDKNDEPVFAVTTSNTAEGDLSEFGAEFGTATSMSGYATITIPIPDDVQDPVEFIAENYGGALNYITKLEDNALSQIEDIEADCANVRSMIARA